MLWLTLLFTFCSAELQFSHHVVLDREGHVHLFWFPGEEDLVFEMVTRTHGWLGIGFSPNGGMAGSDIAVGWVDKMGMPHITDRHAVGNTEPILDEVPFNNHRH